MRFPSPLGDDLYSWKPSVDQTRVLSLSLEASSSLRQGQPGLTWFRERLGAASVL